MSRSLEFLFSVQIQKQTSFVAARYIIPLPKYCIAICKFQRTDVCANTDEFYVHKIILIKLWSQ